MSDFSHVQTQVIDSDASDDDVENLTTDEYSEQQIKQEKIKEYLELLPRKLDYQISDADIKPYFEFEFLFNVNLLNRRHRKIRAIRYRSAFEYKNIIHDIREQNLTDIVSQLYSVHLSERAHLKFTCNWATWPFRPDYEDCPDDIVPTDEDDIRDITEAPQVIHGFGWKGPKNDSSEDVGASGNLFSYNSIHDCSNNSIDSNIELPSSVIKKKRKRFQSQTDPFDIAREEIQKKKKKISNIYNKNGNEKLQDYYARSALRSLCSQAGIDLSKEPLNHLNNDENDDELIFSNYDDISQTAPSFEKIPEFLEYHSFDKNLGRRFINYYLPENQTNTYTDPSDPSTLPYGKISTGSSSLPSNLYRYKITDSKSAYENINFKLKQTDEHTTNEANDNERHSKPGDVIKNQLNPEIGLARDNLSSLEEKRLAHARQLLLYELNALFQRKIYDKIQNENNLAKEKYSLEQLENELLKEMKNNFNNDDEMQKPFIPIVPKVDDSVELPLQSREKLLDLLDSVLILVGYHSHLSGRGKEHDASMRWTEILAKSGASTLGRTFARCKSLFFDNLKDPRVFDSSKPPKSSQSKSNAVISKEDENNELDEGEEDLLFNYNNVKGDGEDILHKRNIDAVQEFLSKLPPPISDNQPVYPLRDHKFIYYEPSTLPRYDPYEEKYVLHGKLTLQQIHALDTSSEFIDPSCHFGNSYSSMNSYKSALSEASAIPGNATFRSPLNGGFTGRSDGCGSKISEETDIRQTTSKYTPAAMDEILGNYGLGKEYFDFSQHQRTPTTRAFRNEEEMDIDDDAPNDEDNQSKTDSSDEHYQELFDSFFFNKVRASRDHEEMVDKIRKQHVSQFYDPKIALQAKRLREVQSTPVYFTAEWRNINYQAKKDSDTDTDNKSEKTVEDLFFNTIDNVDWIMTEKNMASSIEDGIGSNDLMTTRQKKFEKFTQSAFPEKERSVIKETNDSVYRPQTYAWMRLFYNLDHRSNPLYETLEETAKLFMGNNVEVLSEQTHELSDLQLKSKNLPFPPGEELKDDDEIMQHLLTCQRTTVMLSYLLIHIAKRFRNNMPRSLSHISKWLIKLDAIGNTDMKKSLDYYIEDHEKGEEEDDDHYREEMEKRDRTALEKIFHTLNVLEPADYIKVVKFVENEAPKLLKRRSRIHIPPIENKKKQYNKKKQTEDKVEESYLQGFQDTEMIDLADSNNDTVQSNDKIVNDEDTSDEEFDDRRDVVLDHMPYYNKKAYRSLQLNQHNLELNIPFHVFDTEDEYSDEEEEQEQDGNNQVEEIPSTLNNNDDASQSTNAHPFNETDDMLW